MEIAAHEAEFNHQMLDAQLPAMMPCTGNLAHCMVTAIVERDCQSHAVAFVVEKRGGIQSTRINYH